MLLDPDQCFRALKTHDARFDGRFFVGVGTTRVYCRPVCTARTPLRRNCRFFPSAAAAESEGFRPCLRCRPELAPGYATVDANRRLARAAANRIEDGRLEGASLEALAAKLGVTDRHLRRVFKEEFGVSPVEYAQTQRLLLAKRLLTDTQLPVLEVAMASGFASLRRFNDLFKSRYRMTPMELRARAPSSRDADRLVFDLAYRPPYDWPSMLAFLEGRAVKGVEAVDGKRYRRTVRLSTMLTASASPPVSSDGTSSPRRRGSRLDSRLRGNDDGKSGNDGGKGGNDGGKGGNDEVKSGNEGGDDRTDTVGWIEVAPSPRKSALRVTASSSLAGALPLLLARVKSLFDLACRPDEIATALGPLAMAHPGLRLPGSMDGFEIAVRAILGQQVTVKAATTIAGRFVKAFGEAIETPHAGLDRLFPTPATIAGARPSDIAAQGIIAARARAIHALAAAMAEGRLALEPDANVEETLAALQSIPGIGPWTAHYIAMRALAWPDAFPHPDVAVLKAMKEADGRRALAAGESWRPFRAYAVLHLWKSLETPRKRP
jgi:AraC family transcriptional regulator of adaptative response / DNA-3-methyladenine glycosylase II